MKNILKTPAIKTTKTVKNDIYAIKPMNIAKPKRNKKATTNLKKLSEMSMEDYMTERSI